MKFSITRPINSYDRVQKFVASLIRNKTFFIDYKLLNKKEYLEIGVGGSTHDKFIGLDYIWNPKIDVCWDITRGIPFSDNSFRGIYSEHCLEHIPFESIDFVLSEIYRVLKPGGTLRIVIPDGELYLKLYSKAIDGDDSVSLPYSEEEKRLEIYSPIMSINRIFRLYGHQYIYDFDIFRKLLLKNGFRKIIKEKFNSGRHVELLKDLEWRKVESLYIETSK